jgi:phosphatidylserine/phosphatidylglycerophosphate/cardiolipin synthase-like enzyme
MHHKFVMIDFNQPTARLYMGSYNFSVAADSSNGENLLCIKDRRVAISYVVEAVRLFDHYHFRVPLNHTNVSVISWIALFSHYILGVNNEGLNYRAGQSAGRFGGNG